MFQRLRVPLRFARYVLRFYLPTAARAELWDLNSFGALLGNIVFLQCLNLKTCFQRVCQA